LAGPLYRKLDLIRAYLSELIRSRVQHLETDFTEHLTLRFRGETMRDRPRLRR
jgi:hypothetical protein